MLFGNPAVKILEERLWGAAQKRYLQEHPDERNANPKTIMKKARTEYKDSVAASVKEADHKIKAIWSKFRQGMKEQVRAALGVVLRMSDVDWYAVEVGPAATPEVIAAPYQLLKHVTASLLLRSLRKGIDFEDLDGETLEALATYATEQEFEEVLDHARRHYERLEIGERHIPFVLAEVIRGDAYYLGEETHHSLIDVVIFASTLLAGSASLSEGHKKKAKLAVKKWREDQRKNRRSDRRFSGDGWEIGFEQLNSWTKS